MISVKGCVCLSQAAAHCCNDDHQTNGKTGNLTRCRFETPENFIAKIVSFDYVIGFNTDANFYANRHTGVHPTNS